MNRALYVNETASEIVCAAHVPRDESTTRYRVMRLDDIADYLAELSKPPCCQVCAAAIEVAT